MWKKLKRVTKRNRVGYDNIGSFGLFYSQAAQRYGKSKRTIQGWSSRDKIKPILVKGYWIIPWKQIIELDKKYLLTRLK